MREVNTERQIEGGEIDNTNSFCKYRVTIYKPT